MNSVRSILALIMFTCFISPSLCWSATYYVDKNFKNSNESDGTESKPWTTIQKAADSVRPGDTVLVKPGVYFESVDFKKSGNSSDPITFKSTTRNGAVIDGSNSSDLFLVDWNNQSWVIFDGFEVRNSKRYGIWIPGKYSTVKNCYIHHNGAWKSGGTAHTGVNTINAEYIQIIGNEVAYSGWNGISIGSSNNCIVENNYVHDNKYHNGINIMPDPNGEQKLYSGNSVRNNISFRNDAGIYMRWQSKNVISNNLVFDNLTNGIKITYEPSRGSRTYRSDTKIYNNTIVRNKNHGILNESGTHVIIKNNILAYHSKYDINIGQTTGCEVDYNLYYNTESFKWGSGTYYSLPKWQAATGSDRHSIVANPGFEDESQNKFSIIKGSSAINNGLDLTFDNIHFDIVGTPRPQGEAIDIGAYEYRFNSDHADSGMVPPKNLRIEIN